MNLLKASISVSMASLFAVATVQAQVIYNDNIPDGTAQFDAVVAAAGGTVVTDSLSGLSGGTAWSRPGYTITSTNGYYRYIDPWYLNSGEAIGIDPTYDDAHLSGLTFTFDAPINAFGLEIGDWATCCFPSALYISFDGGATRQVAVANTDFDNPGYSDGYRNFVGAIDTTNTFTTITFYGDGDGEYLVAGGTIRYATLDIGSIPNPVPEPETYGMLLAGLGIMGFVIRRRKPQHS